MTAADRPEAVPTTGAAFPRLRDVLSAAICRHVVDGWGISNTADLEDATANVLTALREACTVRTVDQLDALPDESVVLLFGSVIQKHADEWWWAEPTDEPLNMAVVRREFERRRTRPALLVWCPDWSEQ